MAEVKKKTIVIWNVKSTIPIIAWFQAVFLKTKKYYTYSLADLHALHFRFIAPVHIDWAMAQKKCTARCINTLQKTYQLDDIYLWLAGMIPDVMEYLSVHFFPDEPISRWPFHWVVISTTSCFRIILSIISSRMISYTT